MPKDLLIPPLPPDWSEVEQLISKSEEPSQDLGPTSNRNSLSERQQKLCQQAESMRRPLRQAMHMTPQLSPETPHYLQDSIGQMKQAKMHLSDSKENVIQAISHQRRAEQALKKLAEELRKALQTDQGNAVQRMGAGENEAETLARRQMYLLRETQKIHQRQKGGQMPSLARLQDIGAEEGAIKRALSRMSGFFGDALSSQLQQRLRQAQEQLNWLQQQLPQGQLGEPTQSRQQQVLETLLQLAQALSGQQQADQQGQQQTQQGQKPAMADINLGRLVEHGPPMRELPEALRGVKTSTRFYEQVKYTPSYPSASTSITRFNIPTAYREAVQKYLRALK